jgi:hypothetical protein
VKSTALGGITYFLNKNLFVKYHGIYRKIKMIADIIVATVIFL